MTSLGIHLKEKWYFPINFKYPEDEYPFYYFSAASFQFQHTVFRKKAVVKYSVHYNTIKKKGSMNVFEDFITKVQLNKKGKKKRKLKVENLWWTENIEKSFYFTMFLHRSGFN